MKKLISNLNVRKILFLPLFILIAFISCQDEIVEQTDPDEQETIVANSNLANLMQRTCGDDGSDDNILDGSDCISINLPVTIIVNGIEITINTLEDLALIQDIYDQSNNDVDALEFIFPITIILNDYTTVVINNLEELEQFIEDCTNNEEEDDIECIDFVYPISFSIYNADFQLIDTVTVNSDEELYAFINNLEGGLVASLNYPVSLVYADGTVIEVNNNQELEDAINAAEEECDDDEDDCDDEDVELALKECVWNIVSFNGNNELEQFDLDFTENFDVFVYEGDTVIGEGNWSVSETNEGLVLVLNLNFEGLAGQWLIIECDDDRFKLTRGDDYIIIEQDCDDNTDDCTEQQVDDYLMECHWVAGFNGGNNFGDYNFNFNANQELLVTNDQGNDIVTGTWETFLYNNGTVGLSISLPAPLGDFTDEWEVFECSEDRIKVISNSNNDIHIVFERDCENNNPFECFESFNAQLIECDDNGDGFADFDLENVYANCADPSMFNITFHESQVDADTNVNPLVSPYTNVANPQAIYARVELANDPNTFNVYQVELIVDDCGSGCSETDVDGYLVECIWNVVNFNGDDNLIDWDMDFNADGTVVIEGQGMVINAMWSTTETTDGVWVDFSNVAGPGIQAISGTWLVVECEEGRLELHNNTNDIIVLERNCN